MSIPSKEYLKHRAMGQLFIKTPLLEKHPDLDVVNQVSKTSKLDVVVVAVQSLDRGDPMQVTKSSIPRLLCLSKICSINDSRGSKSNLVRRQFVWQFTNMLHWRRIGKRKRGEYSA